MDVKALLDTIDMPRREFSILLVTPKPEFLEWLSDFANRKGLGKYRLYVSEDNAALIIPRIDYFSEPGSLAQFIAELKPILLRGELSRFSVGMEDFERPITAEIFDQLFEFDIRGSAMFLSDLWPV